jgi:hypothetical protein
MMKSKKMRLMRARAFRLDANLNSECIYLPNGLQGALQRTAPQRRPFQPTACTSYASWQIPGSLTHSFRLSLRGTVGSETANRRYAGESSLFDLRTSPM